MMMHLTTSSTHGKLYHSLGGVPLSRGMVATVQIIRSQQYHSITIRLRSKEMGHFCPL